MAIKYGAFSQNEIDQCLKELAVYGYCILEQFMNRSTVSLLKERVLSLHSGQDVYDGVPERDKNDGIVYNLQSKDKVFVDLLSGDVLHDVLMPKLNDPYYRFLPADVPNYYLHYYNARSSGNKLDLHIDSHFPFVGKRSIVMQTAFLLDDHTEENGCTVVVPGSHMTGDFTDRELSNVSPVNARAGDLVMWDSRLWHGAMENRSGTSRWSLIATWGMWWIKPAMDITRSLPDEIYQLLDDKQKQLLGFCCIPPADEKDRINTKQGYDTLCDSVGEYYGSNG